ncbi:MAG: hypothetical protein QGI21_04095 [Candidatus Poseidoniaceae archaeon]|jgi:hypothetical protein|nr:hypothetical protein [Candidatus Poseidoniaceae archaeon]
MDTAERQIRIWCEDAFGQSPIDLSIWADDEDVVQVLLRLNKEVVIADLSWDENTLFEETTMVISLDNWQPGSIQTRRLSDGMVRFKHRTKEIILSPRVRAPEWASALLEEWLLDMRGDDSKPRDKRRRIADLKRSRDVAERMLEQAELSEIKDTINQIDSKLNKIDSRLAGIND